MSEQQTRSANGIFNLCAIGNLGADPESRFTPAGKQVTNMRVAINLPVWDTATSQMTVAALWLRLTTWDKVAENCHQYLRKGSQIYFESNRPTFDPNTGGPPVFQRADGTWGASFEFTSFTIKFLDRAGTQHEATVESQDGQPVAVAGGEEVLFAG